MLDRCAVQTLETPAVYGACVCVCGRRVRRGVGSSRRGVIFICCARAPVHPGAAAGEERLCRFRARREEQNAGVPVVPDRDCLRGVLRL